MVGRKEDAMAVEEPTPVVRVAAGADLYGERRRADFNTVDFKVATADGSLLILELTCHRPGGPVRHVHPVQDEWFYAVVGEFLVEVGQERFRLQPGDSLLLPRAVPHAWAYVGSGGGRLLVAYTPAGRIEAFFREAARGTLVRDPEVFRAYGLEVVGPPLALESLA
jgi:quercetin dioxygenase-like cupin family protein